MTIRLHRGDLPDLSRYRGAVAIDTETMGLDHRRDRLCVVQLAPGDGSADVVQIPRNGCEATHLRTLLADPKILKIFHFARFDLGTLFAAFAIMPGPVYCTKIASRLVRTAASMSKPGIEEASWLRRFETASWDGPPAKTEATSASPSFE